MSTPVNPSEKEFRDCGYTKDAINYPLTEAGFIRLCDYNGINPENAPRAWRFAPNKALQDRWNTPREE